MENARRIHADLIRGDFAQESATIAQARFQTCKDILVVSQASEAQLKSDLKKAQDDKTTEGDRRKKLQLEAWAWRILAGITLFQLLR
ncbi:hypothetical protein GCM10028803_05240 [Larkinella knui]|uniref:Uncharacterized protein n=1 Tax=Larkinella knui TaxID=2025310 RepID=A0A3P1CKQ9_9BACT|nr:hypothetical protein [Larkinella knui]RRB13798.1 hypothetical protein EHT87_16195 [Larkinella knui]